MKTFCWWSCWDSSGWCQQIFLSSSIKWAGVTWHSQLNTQEIYFIKSVCLPKFKVLVFITLDCTCQMVVTHKNKWQIRLIKIKFLICILHQHQSSFKNTLLWCILGKYSKVQLWNIHCVTHVTQTFAAIMFFQFLNWFQCYFLLLYIVSNYALNVSLHLNTSQENWKV